MSPKTLSQNKISPSVQANSGFFGGIITRDQPRPRSPAQLTLINSKPGTPEPNGKEHSLHCSMNDTRPIGQDLLFKVLHQFLD